jgi:hypothetical protein
MRFRVYNGWGDSIDDPSPAELARFVQAIDPADREHGAVWIRTDDDRCLEWNADGHVLYSTPDERVRHRKGMSVAEALALWQALVGGDDATLEAIDWKPGNGYELSAEQRERAFELQRQRDREFYDILGPERDDVPCRDRDCTRGAISLSTLCRPHHFEMVWKRPSPFWD